MLTAKNNLIAFCLLFVLAGFSAFSAGIPEPGLLFYGKISNRQGQSLLSTATLEWKIESPSRTLVIPSSVIRINGESFYVLKVPFETPVPGVPVSANAFEFLSQPSSFRRIAWIGTNNATIVFSSLGRSNTFRFPESVQDRGLIERLDLNLDMPVTVETFEQWSMRIFGRIVDPNADPLGKGMTYHQQYLAGTDPLDDSSVFQFIDIKPDLDGGLSLLWQSASGKAYIIEKSTNLHLGFTVLKANVQATPPVNAFRDQLVPTTRQMFYKLRLAE